MRGLFLVLLCAASMVGQPSIGFAEESVPTSTSAIEKRLSNYDPAAVAAARHYYTTPAVRTGMIAIIDNMEKAMFGVVAKQNPSLNQDQMSKVQLIVGNALKERLDLLIQMNMVVALDTFTTNELVALDRFYSAPEGAAIMAKLPQLTARLPAMIQTIMPDYMNEIRTKLKVTVPELKL